MKYLYFAVAVAFIACITSANSQSPMTEPEFIRQYLESLKEAGFNKDIMPEGNGGYGSPVDLEVTMHILNVHKVNDYGMDYEVDFYFRQHWNDSRLAYYDKDISEIILNDPSKIWVPDLFFVQEKEAVHHQIVTPNTFVWIMPAGEVLYSIRLTATFHCPMDFTKFPHDVQKCTFSAESYGRTADKIELHWGKRYILSYGETIKTHDFELTDVSPGTDRVTVNKRTYSTLTVTFTFERFTGYYVRRLYIPFILLAIISWASFWIPLKMMALRLTLLLVVLYLMITITTEISCYFPPTSYLKGGDIWIAVCQSMVFAAFLQFIFVYIIAKSAEKARKRPSETDTETQVLDFDAKTFTMNCVSSNSASNVVASRLKNNILLPSRIDKLCAIIFPIFFALFNFIYFLVYCTGK